MNISKNISLKGHKFDGPYRGVVELKEIKKESGVYAVIVQFHLRDNSTFNRIIDIGESDNVNNRLKKHDRKSCWQKYQDPYSETYCYAVYYCNESERMHLEAKLRNEYKLPCGSW